MPVLFCFALLYYRCPSKVRRFRCLRGTQRLSQATIRRRILALSRQAELLLYFILSSLSFWSFCVSFSSFGQQLCLLTPLAKDLENILSDESDSNGLLRIETLRFSRRGRTGIYKVRFTAFASTESLSLAMQCAR